MRSNFDVSRLGWAQGKHTRKKVVWKCMCRNGSGVSAEGGEGNKGAKQRKGGGKERGRARRQEKETKQNKGTGRWKAGGARSDPHDSFSQ